MALFGQDKPVPAANGITLEEALRVITAARQKAEEIGVMMNIAVVDEGGGRRGEGPADRAVALSQLQ